MPMAPTRTYLGQVVDLGRVAEDATVTLEAKPISREELAEELISMAAEDVIPPARASKARGKAGWIGSSSYGRCGRFGLGVLKKFQYAKSPLHVSDDDAKSLRLLAAMIASVPPRIIKALAPPRPRLVVYSDASWEKEARLGWIIITPGANRATVARTSIIQQELLDNLVERTTQIMACEAVAVPQAILREPHLFAGCDVTWFIDNEAACSSLIRGSSSQEDISIIASITHFLMMEHDIRIWYEWIDSKSNPADGLSRDGLLDKWTKQQGWSLEESASLQWNELVSALPFQLH